MPTKPAPTMQITEMKGNQRLYPPCETYGKANQSTEICYFGANAAKRPPSLSGRLMLHSQNQRQDTRNETNETAQAAAQTSN